MAKRSKKQKGSQKIARTAQPQAQGIAPVINWKLCLLQTVIIAAAGLWVFSPAMHGEWLWDDDLLITKNAVVHDPGGLWKIWFEPDKLFDFFPLKVSVEWLEWHLWHNDTFGYHLTSIILHILSALLVWRLFAKLGLRFAWLGGLLFAIHPVTVESVTWIAELKNTLSLPPFLLAMCAFIDYENQGKRSDYFLALGFFLAAMLCKTTMVMFPMVILLYIWWRRGRIGMKALKASVPFFAVSLGLGLVTLGFLNQHAIGQNHIAMGDFFSRLALAGVSIAFYFSTCFWPVGLTPIYPKWTIDPPSPIQFLPWPVLGGVIYWLWTKKTDWGRHALLGLGFFLINLMPFVGFTSASYMGFSWVMDHILYIPLIGLIGLVIAGLGQIEKKFSNSIRSVGIGIVTVGMAFLAWESHRYAGMFVNNIMLWTYTLQCNPDAWLAHNNLGYALERAGRINEAIKQDEQAIAMMPDYADAHQNLGNAFLAAGRINEAIEEDEKVLKITPNNANVHGNLGITLFKVNRLQEAIEQFQLAVKFNPDDIPGRNNLAIALIQAHRFPEVIEQFQQVLKIDPDSADVHSHLGFAFGMADRVPEAIEQYEIALRINPNDTETRNRLAQLQATQKTTPETGSSGK